MLKSTRITFSQVWTAPARVSMIWVTSIGGGGGGGNNPGFNPFNPIAACASSGSSGEFAQMYPVPVVPGATYPILIGAGGTGATGSGINDAFPGESTTLGGAACKVLGGEGAFWVTGFGQTFPGYGGGPLGGSNTNTPPNPYKIRSAGKTNAATNRRGFRESPTCWGGTSGNGVGVGSQDGDPGGLVIGQYDGLNVGPHSTSNNRGGGDSGGTSIFGNGGTGGDGTATQASGLGEGQPAPANTGAGGGGASGTGNGPPAGQRLGGGAGGSGVLMIFWFG